jgi:ornithine cyclodeaminase/alanine dehydrogenase-like protein (mu-crystallin family)
MTTPPPSPGAGFPAIIGGGLLRSLVPMPDAIEASRKAFTAATAGELTGPPRSALSRHRVLVMPAEHSSGSALIKVISLQPSGWEQGLPSIGGGVLWVDGASGRITALLDATSLTALRTGAATGLATSILAGPASSVLAMLGAGGQAADQVGAVCAVRPIRQVRVFSRRADRREKLCAQLAAAHPGVSFQPAASPREAVRGADVICTATRSQAPLFEAGDLAPQAHINAIGAYTADMCEIPAAAFAQAALVVIDQLAAVMAEAGDLIQAIDAGQLRRESLVEMGHLLAAQGSPPAGLTIFKSVGIAAQDWALGELVVSRARERGAIPSDAGADILPV